MGNDGGSIPDRRDLVRTKAKAEQADKANQTRARWLFCALSKTKLQEPVVSCALGKLYNKDAIIEFLLDRSLYGDGENICGHIRSLKDVKALKLTPNPAPRSPDSDQDQASFICPLTLREMNGVQPFVYLWTCGCTFARAGLKSVAISNAKSRKENGSSPDGEAQAKDKEPTPEESFEVCPRCAKKFSPLEDIITLNPSSEEEENLRIIMDRRKAKEPAKKSKKRKAEAAGDEPPTKKKETAKPSTNSNISAASKAVMNSLAEEEAKRKANMSEAVKSLYESSGTQHKETFMTRGTFNRYAA